MTTSLIWLSLALVAVTIEAAVTNLVFLFVALAALLAAYTAALGAEFLVQVGAFGLTSLALPLLLRPRLLTRLGGQGVPSRTEALVGELAQVTDPIDPVLGTGRVIVNGHDWAAQSSAPLAAGTIVRIDGADGIVLLVRPVATTSSIPPTQSV
ncbi:MAG TPA: NfeD family protein [Gemmatimonadales bacterium]|nr:NfeD family protein [Gemmatimonadales bacterium]